MNSMEDKTLPSTFRHSFSSMSPLPHLARDFQCDSCDTSSIGFQFQAVLSVLSFFIGTCVVHALTDHCPVSATVWESLKRNACLMVFPISTGIDSIHSIVIFAWSIGRLGCGAFFLKSHSLQRAVTSGGIAIRVPDTFVQVVPRTYLGWSLVSDAHDIVELCNDSGLHSPKGSKLFKLPRTTRVVGDHYTINRVYPASNSLATVIALLQLAYGAYQSYVEYAYLIRDQGLSSPFLFSLPYLYMSFVNLIANLVRASYTPITVLSPVTAHNTVEPRPEERQSSVLHGTPMPLSRAIVESPNPRVPPPMSRTIHSQKIFFPTSQTPVSLPCTDVQANGALQSATQTSDFESWFTRSYPGLMIEAAPHLEFLSFIIHYLCSIIVLLILIGYFTSFKSEGKLSQYCFIFAIFMDPVTSLVLAGINVCFVSTSGITNVIEYGRRFITGCCTVIGYVIAGKLLYESYLNTSI